jgi:cytidylate kinase
MIVTIDGPAGSGKSSTARAVAERLGFRHLDSGAFYRALTWAVLDAGIPASRWATLRAGDLDALRVHGEPAHPGYHMYAAGRDITHLIRSPEVNANVSPIAALPAVRGWLHDRLRAAASAGNLVADGRDMGSVVFPEADLKFFLVAETTVRAWRRLLERGLDPAAPGAVDAEVRAIEARDRIDSTRAVAPLCRPEGALEIDTTSLTFEQQVGAIVEQVRALQARRSA